VAEFFDSGGQKETNYRFGALRHFFREAHQPPIITSVNEELLQTASDDLFCQTYIYYFVYQRVMQEKSSYEIVSYLSRLSEGQRVTLMRAFNAYLLYDTRIKRKFIDPLVTTTNKKKTVAAAAAAVGTARF
jgi:hypothetical protein